jgi:hypothetical protein
LLTPGVQLRADESVMRVFRVFVGNYRRHILTAAIFCVAAPAILAEVLTAPSQQRLLTLQPGSLDFGEVWAQPHFRWTMMVSNPTDQAINVDQIDTSCRCVSVEPSSFSINPGDSLVLNVSMNLQGEAADRQQAAGGIDRESVTISLTPHVRGSMRTESWHIHGTVRRAVLTSAAAIDFGDVSRDALKRSRQTILVRCVEPDSTLAVETALRFGPVAITPVSGDKGLHQIDVGMSENTPIGTVNSELVIKPSTHDGAPLPSLRLPISANVLGDIEAVPSAIAFSVVSPGQGVEESLVLRSRNNTAFDVENVAVDDDGLSAVMEAGAASQKRCIVRLMPSKGAARRACIRFDIRSRADGHEESVRVPVTYSSLGSSGNDLALAKTTPDRCGCRPKAGGR